MDHVTVVTGEEFRITLESFGGAGYEWRLREEPPGFRLEARESLPPEAGAPPGSPHRVVFRLVAQESGTYEAVFVLQRPWEADALREQAYAVDVRP